MNELPENQTPDAEEGRTTTTPPAEEPEPRYEKPRLRRYDQIDQVRPYGPSEV